MCSTDRSGAKKPGPDPETLKIDLPPEEGLERLLRPRQKPSKPKRKPKTTGRKR